MSTEVSFGVINSDNKLYAEIGDAKPVKKRHWPISPVMEDLIFREIKKMLASGITKRNPIQLQFLGLSVWYWRLVGIYATIATALTADETKQMVTSSPIL